jgi:hypothetical protein
MAIHLLYGLSVAVAQPYCDLVDDAGTNHLGNLDKVSIFHSAVQVLLLVAGLAANKDNGDAISIVVFLLVAAAMAASAVVFKHIRARARAVGVKDGPPSGVQPRPRAVEDADRAKDEYDTATR